MVDFQKKDLDKKKVFVVRDGSLGFSLPSLLVNPALDLANLFRGEPRICIPLSSLMASEKINIHLATLI